jgi:hypothetical protein
MSFDLTLSYISEMCFYSIYSLDWETLLRKIDDSGENETAFDSGLTKLSSLKGFRISEADDPIGDQALKLKIASGIAINSSSQI